MKLSHKNPTVSHLIVRSLKLSHYCQEQDRGAPLTTPFQRGGKSDLMEYDKKRKEEIKLTLVIDVIIMYVDNPKH